MPSYAGPSNGNRRDGEHLQDEPELEGAWDAEAHRKRPNIEGLVR